MSNHPILTDARCRPFERPERPSADAGIDAHIAFIRALADYNDAVSDCANKAFDVTFRKHLKKGLA